MILAIVIVIIGIAITFNYFVSEFVSDYVPLSKWTVFFILLLCPPLGLLLILYALMKKIEGKPPLHSKHKKGYPLPPMGYPPMGYPTYRYPY